MLKIKTSNEPNTQQIKNKLTINKQVKFSQILRKKKHPREAFRTPNRNNQRKTSLWHTLSKTSKYNTKKHWNDKGKTPTYLQRKTHQNTSDLSSTTPKTRKAWTIHSKFWRSIVTKEDATCSKPLSKVTVKWGEFKRTTMKTAHQPSQHWRNDLTEY